MEDFDADFTQCFSVPQFLAFTPCTEHTSSFMLCLQARMVTDGPICNGLRSCQFLPFSLYPIITCCTSLVFVASPPDIKSVLSCLCLAGGQTVIALPIYLHKRVSIPALRILWLGSQIRFFLICGQGPFRVLFLTPCIFSSQQSQLMNM